MSSRAIIRFRTVPCTQLGLQVKRPDAGFWRHGKIDLTCLSLPWATRSTARLVTYTARYVYSTYVIVYSIYERRCRETRPTIYIYYFSSYFTLVSRVFFSEQCLLLFPLVFSYLSQFPPLPQTHFFNPRFFLIVFGER